MSAASPSQDRSFDQPSGLLPVDPPARAARWTGWLLLSLALAAAIFAVAFKLPETVVAPFVIEPVDGAAPVQASVAGRLASVHVRAGQIVKAGDTLFQIRSDSVRDADARLRQLIEDQRALAEQIEKRDAAHQSELTGHDAQIALARRELEFRQQHHATTRALVERKGRAVAEGLLPELTLLADQLIVAESESARVLAEQQLQQLQLTRQERVDQRSRERTDEAATAQKLGVQSSALQAQLQGSQGDLESIRAPYDAVVLSLTEQTPGSVIALGDELCQLARENAVAQVRLLLPEPDLPRLRAGQEVRLFLAAYPFQRHGTLSTGLTWISPTPQGAAASAQFFALAAVPAQDPRMPLRIGMTGEARVLTGRRTLLELALEPMRALRERQFR
jgi:multidrug efflux pump subunit AcrA (membrane-fusion protein)